MKNTDPSSTRALAESAQTGLHRLVKRSNSAMGFDQAVETFMPEWLPKSFISLFAFTRRWRVKRMQAELAALSQHIEQLESGRPALAGMATLVRGAGEQLSVEAPEHTKRTANIALSRVRRLIQAMDEPVTHKTD